MERMDLMVDVAKAKTSKEKTMTEDKFEYTAEYRAADITLGWDSDWDILAGPYDTREDARNEIIREIEVEDTPNESEFDYRIIRTLKDPSDSVVEEIQGFRR